MKINKKIVVATLSTALGLGIVGSISGTVAWYQYSTKGMLSIIGNNVSEGGVLSISTDHTNWHRDLYTADVSGNFEGKFTPVTFGGLAKDAALPKTGDDLNAYFNPKWGYTDMTKWGKAEKDANDTYQEFLQYDIYLKAEKPNASTGAMEAFDTKVYISDMEIENASGAKPIAEAVRVHISVNDGVKNFIIARSEQSIDTHGSLDLDGNGSVDIDTEYEWGNTGDPLDYGSGQLKSYNLTEIITVRGDDGYLDTTTGVEICSTSNTYVKLTITVWLEGWQKLGTPADAIWNVANQGGATFNLGMTFDVGRGAYSA